MATAEILSIGTELLLGQILNTNTQFLSEQLAATGIDCLYHTTVGDNTTRIVAAFQTALSRSDIVISTGGLGPTPDDLTHECIAQLFSAEMVFDAATLDRIREAFSRRNIEMPESNRKQAMRPSGSEILTNMRGTAPGIIWNLKGELLEQIGIADSNRERYILTFPGVPHEMKAMWHSVARPYLQQVYGVGVIWSCDLKHFGIGESALAERYEDLMDGTNPTVAPYAGTGECRLRVTAKASTVEEAKAIAEPTIRLIKEKSGHLCYGMDDDTLEIVVGKMLASREMKVAFAESCTGGLLSKRITDIPGSSAYMTMSVVTYSNASKQTILGVSEQTLTANGAVSRECAAEMADGILKLSKADIGLSITGIAGPDGGTPDKPVGLVYIGLAGADRTYVAKRLNGITLSRTEIRHRTASDALNMIRLYLIDPALLEEHYAQVR